MPDLSPDLLFVVGGDLSQLEARLNQLGRAFNIEVGVAFTPQASQAMAAASQGVNAVSRAAKAASADTDKLEKDLVKVTTQLTRLDQFWKGVQGRRLGPELSQDLEAIARAENKLREGTALTNLEMARLSRSLVAVSAQVETVNRAGQAQIQNAEAIRVAEDRRRAGLQKTYESLFGIGGVQERQAAQSARAAAAAEAAETRRLAGLQRLYASLFGIGGVQERQAQSARLAAVQQEGFLKRQIALYEQLAARITAAGGVVPGGAQATAAGFQTELRRLQTGGAAVMDPVALRARTNAAQEMTRELRGIAAASQETTGVMGFLDATFLRVGTRILAATAIYAGFRTAMQGVGFLIEVDKQLGQIAATMERGSDRARVMRESYALLKQGMLTMGLDAKTSGGLVFELSKVLDNQTHLIRAAYLPALALTSIKETEQEDTIRTLIGAYNIFGPTLRGATTETEKFTRISDILLASSFASVASVKDFTQALQYVGPSAASAGIQFEETVTLLGLLQDGFVRASRSGTGLSNLLEDLRQRGPTIARIFNIAIDPARVEPLELLRKVIERIRALGLGNRETILALQEAFPGLRETRALEGFLLTMDKYEEKLKIAENSTGRTKDVLRELGDTASAAAGRLRGTLFIELDALLKALFNISEFEGNRPGQGIATFFDFLSAGITQVSTQAKDLITILRELAAIASEESGGRLGQIAAGAAAGASAAGSTALDVILRAFGFRGGITGEGGFRGALRELGVGRFDMGSSAQYGAEAELFGGTTLAQGMAAQRPRIVESAEFIRLRTERAAEVERNAAAEVARQASHAEDATFAFRVHAANLVLIADAEKLLEERRKYIFAQEKSAGSDEAAQEKLAAVRKEYERSARAVADLTAARDRDRQVFEQDLAIKLAQLTGTELDVKLIEIEKQKETLLRTAKKLYDEEIPALDYSSIVAGTQAFNALTTGILETTAAAQGLSGVTSVVGEFADEINAAAEKYGVSAALIRSVIATESNFNPLATSPKGAEGLMQLMPATSRALGVENAFDPQQNIEGGTRHLKSLLDKYKDVQVALAAYNAGEGAVAKYGGIPPFLETQRYVERVMGGLGLAKADKVEIPITVKDETKPVIDDIQRALDALTTPPPPILITAQIVGDVNAYGVSAFEGGAEESRTGRQQDRARQQYAEQRALIGQFADLQKLQARQALQLKVETVGLTPAEEQVDALSRALADYRVGAKSLLQETQTLGADFEYFADRLVEKSLGVDVAAASLRSEAAAIELVGGAALKAQVAAQHGFQSFEAMAEGARQIAWIQGDTTLLRMVEAFRKLGAILDQKQIVELDKQISDLTVRLNAGAAALELDGAAAIAAAAAWTTYKKSLADVAADPALGEQAVNKLRQIAVQTQQLKEQATAGGLIRLGLDQMASQEIAHQNALLEEQLGKREEGIRALEDYNRAAERFNEQQLRAIQEISRANGDIFKFFLASLAEAAGAAGSFYDDLKKGAQDVIRSLQQALQTAIIDGFHRTGDALKNFWKNLLKSLEQDLAAFLSSTAVRALAQLFLGASGGGTNIFSSAAAALGLGGSSGGAGGTVTKVQTVDANGNPIKVNFSDLLVSGGSQVAGQLAPGGGSLLQGIQNLSVNWDAGFGGVKGVLFGLPASTVAIADLSGGAGAALGAVGGVALEGGALGIETGVGIAGSGAALSAAGAEGGAAAAIGGVQAVDTAATAGFLGAGGAIGSATVVLAAVVALYEAATAINALVSGAEGREKNAAIGTLAGLGAGAAGGAVVGSVFPGVGTVIGAIVGAAIGAAGGNLIGGLFGPEFTNEQREAMELAKALKNVNSELQPLAETRNFSALGDAIIALQSQSIGGQPQATAVAIGFRNVRPEQLQPGAQPADLTQFGGQAFLGQPTGVSPTISKDTFFNLVRSRSEDLFVSIQQGVEQGLLAPSNEEIRKAIIDKVKILDELNKAIRDALNEILKESIQPADLTIRDQLQLAAQNFRTIVDALIQSNRLQIEQLEREAAEAVSPIVILEKTAQIKQLIEARYNDEIELVKRFADQLDQLSVVFRELQSSIADQIDSLREQYGTPDLRGTLARRQEQFVDAFAQFQETSDPAAAQKVQTLANSVLEAASKVYTRPSPQFREIFNDVIATLEEVSDQAADIEQAFNDALITAIAEGNTIDELTEINTRKMADDLAALRRNAEAWLQSAGFEIADVPGVVETQAADISGIQKSVDAPTWTGGAQAPDMVAYPPIGGGGIAPATYEEAVLRNYYPGYGYLPSLIGPEWLPKGQGGLPFVSSGMYQLHDYEAVLNPTQASAWRQWQAGQGGGATMHLTIAPGAIVISGVSDPERAADLAVRRVEQEMRTGRLGYIARQRVRA